MVSQWDNSEEAKASRNRRGSRDVQFRRANVIRARMSDEEIEIERLRLVCEVTAMAQKLKLSTENIGREWDQNGVDLELNTDGQMPKFKGEPMFVAGVLQ